MSHAMIPAIGIYKPLRGRKPGSHVMAPQKKKTAMKTIPLPICPLMNCPRPGKKAEQIAGKVYVPFLDLVKIPISNCDQ